MERIDRIAAVNDLLDIYGPLLTQRQLDALTACYQEDMSLAEIAENTGGTRQAVHDLIHRGETQLLHYEQTLHILEDRQQRKALLSQMQALLDRNVPDPEARRRLRELADAVSRI